MFKDLEGTDAWEHPEGFGEWRGVPSPALFRAGVINDVKDKATQTIAFA